MKKIAAASAVLFVVACSAPTGGDFGALCARAGAVAASAEHWLGSGLLSDEAELRLRAALDAVDVACADGGDPARAEAALLGLVSTLAMVEASKRGSDGAE